MRRLTTLLILLATTGCSVVVGGDLDPLELDPSSRRDVGIRLVEFVPHLNQPIVVEFFDPERNFVLAGARVDPLMTTCVDLSFPLGATVGATMVDFYADVDIDGLDPPEGGMGDHVWREELDESGRLVFPHEFNFTDITMMRPNPPGGDLILDLTGFDANEADTAVVSLIQEVNLAPVSEDPDLRDSINAIYVSAVIDGNVGPRRMAPMTEGPPRIRGIVDGGVMYTIELNLNGTRSCLDQAAPASGDFTVTATPADFGDCSGDPAMVFEDCAR